MNDLRDQLRAYFDEVDPSFDVADLMREPRPELSPTRSRVPNGPLIAAVAAVVVVLVVGLPLLLSGGRSESAVEPSVTTALPATTTLATAPVFETVPEYLTGLLSCLPLDPAGWSRSEPLPALGAPVQLPPEALTAASGTAVAIGMDINGNFKAYWSHDGVEWAPAEGFPEAKVVGTSPPAVAGGANGFVAVVVPDIYPGVAPANHPDTPPIVAFSQDGITWDVLDPETLPTNGVLWLSDVYAGPAGFLITGAITTDLPGTTATDDTGSFVWASPDGRSWSVTDYPAESWPYPGVVATDTGWATHTETGTLIQPTEIWLSTNGVNWYETENEGPDTIAAEFRAAPTAVHGDTWVSASSLQIRRAPTVWTSTDDGATWDEYAIGGDPAAEEYASWDIASTPLGLLMTGRHDFGRDHTNLLHYSTDGRDWQLCTTPRLGPDTATGFTEITMLGDTLILLDSETGIFYTWNDPNAHP